MSISNHPGAFNAAIDSITSALREKMSRSVANGPEMPSEKSKNDGAKPKSIRRGDKMLSPRQLAAARLLVTGKSVVCAAQMLEIDPRTIFRWKRCPKFQAEVRSQVDALTAKPKPAPRPAEPQRNEYLEAYLRTIQKHRLGSDMSRSVLKCRELPPARGQK